MLAQWKSVLPGGYIKKLVTTFDSGGSQRTKGGVGRTFVFLTCHLLPRWRSRAAKWFEARPWSQNAWAQILSSLILAQDHTARK